MTHSSDTVLGNEQRHGHSTGTDRLNDRLIKLPGPEVASNQPLWGPRDQSFHLMAKERSSLNAPTVIDLWPEGVPGQLPAPPAPQSDGDRCWSIHSPSMTVFPPPNPAPAAPIILVIPGGGYQRNGWLNGGLRIARWLNSIGITAAVLKYRLHEYDDPAQLQDAQRALRILRLRAAEWGGAPQNIGVIGSSAGGHLAAYLSTAWDQDTGCASDPMAGVSARPDFQLLLYPVITGREDLAHIGSRDAIMGETPAAARIDAFSIEKKVRPDTPPTFIVATAVDEVVPVENSLLLYQALLRANVSADLHLYQEGPHGFSTRHHGLPVDQWTAVAQRWMIHHNFLPPPLIH